MFFFHIQIAPALTQQKTHSTRLQNLLTCFAMPPDVKLWTFAPVAAMVVHAGAPVMTRVGCAALIDIFKPQTT